MIYITLDDILLEASLSNLKNNVQRNFGNSRASHAPRVRVVNYQIIPFVQDKELLIKANIRGNDANYKTQIRFINVKFSKELQPGFISLNGVDGGEYIVKQFTSSQTRAKVNCNCLDFYYRFALWNDARRSLEGNPPPTYVKRTDMPPVNPGHIPGACKHILKLVTFLKDERIVR